MRNVALALFGLAVVACGGASTSSSSPAATTTAGVPAKTVTAPDGLVLQGEGGAAVPVNELVGKKKLTVLLFFTGECPVQKAHDARFREIVTAYEGKGVTFAAIASETGADVNAEREEAKKRQLPSLYEDRGAALADALGVEYSTHAVVLDAERHVLYSGAVDSDRTHMKDGSERYLKNAIEDALAGRPVRKAKTEALGCPLRKH